MLMRTVNLLLASLCFAACSKAPDASPTGSRPAGGAAESRQSRPFDDECTLATPLVPGVPGSPGHLVKSSRNPNGDSELALLMRRFVEDLRAARPALEAGRKLDPWWPVHRKMRCAWPTDLAERNERFDGLAQGYLRAVRAFDEKPGKETYNGVIAGCVSCHAASCGGPLDFIEGMRWL